MSHNVSTQWNSTYDMLEFAVKYRSAIDDITGNKSVNLCKYELDNEEWRIAMQLQTHWRCIVLRSHFGNGFTSQCSLAGARFSRMLHSFSLIQHIALQLSFLLWTILMKPSPISLLIQSLNPPSVLLLKLPIKTQ